MKKILKYLILAICIGLYVALFCSVFVGCTSCSCNESTQTDDIDPDDDDYGDDDDDDDEGDRPDTPADDNLLVTQDWVSGYYFDEANLGDTLSTTATGKRLTYDASGVKSAPVIVEDDEGAYVLQIEGLGDNALKANGLDAGEYYKVTVVFRTTETATVDGLRWKLGTSTVTTIRNGKTSLNDSRTTLQVEAIDETSAEVTWEVYTAAAKEGDSLNLCFTSAQTIDLYSIEIETTVADPDPIEVDTGDDNMYAASSWVNGVSGDYLTAIPQVEGVTLSGLTVTLDETEDVSDLVTITDDGYFTLAQSYLETLTVGFHYFDIEYSATQIYRVRLNVYSLPTIADTLEFDWADSENLPTIETTVDMGGAEFVGLTINGFDIGKACFDYDAETGLLKIYPEAINEGQCIEGENAATLVTTKAEKDFVIVCYTGGDEVSYDTETYKMQTLGENVDFTLKDGGKGFTVAYRKATLAGTGAYTTLTQDTEYTYTGAKIGRLSFLDSFLSKFDYGTVIELQITVSGETAQIYKIKTALPTSATAITEYQFSLSTIGNERVILAHKYLDTDGASTVTASDLTYYNGVGGEAKAVNATPTVIEDAVFGRALKLEGLQESGVLSLTGAKYLGKALKITITFHAGGSNVSDMLWRWTSKKNADGGTGVDVVRVQNNVVTVKEDDRSSLSVNGDIYTLTFYTYSWQSGDELLMQLPSGAQTFYISDIVIDSEGDAPETISSQNIISGYDFTNLSTGDTVTSAESSDLCLRYWAIGTNTEPIIVADTSFGGTTSLKVEGLGINNPGALSIDNLPADEYLVTMKFRVENDATISGMLWKQGTDDAAGARNVAWIQNGVITTDYSNGITSLTKENGIYTWSVWVPKSTAATEQLFLWFTADAQTIYVSELKLELADYDYDFTKLTVGGSALPTADGKGLRQWAMEGNSSEIVSDTSFGGTTSLKLTAGAVGALSIDVDSIGSETPYKVTMKFRVDSGVTLGGGMGLMWKWFTGVDVDGDGEILDEGENISWITNGELKDPDGAVYPGTLTQDSNGIYTWSFTVPTAEYSTSQLILWPVSESITLYIGSLTIER